MSNTTTIVGVLALQGAFAEHVHRLEQIPNVRAVEIRTPHELAAADLAGLVLPGGESTSIGLLASKTGLVLNVSQLKFLLPCHIFQWCQSQLHLCFSFCALQLEPLREWVHAQRRPVFGTCAGLVMLADRALGQKQNGQPLLGGLDALVHRNYFGAQICSFECDLDVSAAFNNTNDASPSSSSDQSSSAAAPFRALFIRAPAMVEVGPNVRVLASYPDPHAVQQQGVVVAARQDHLLVTAFHPELTRDLRWHQLFVDMCRQHKQQQQQQ